MHFIVLGHGKFASGIVSAAQLICGQSNVFHVVEFLEGMSAEQLSQQLFNLLAKIDSKRTIIFTDILGGTPFREAALLAQRFPGVEVITGTNVQILVEAELEQDHYTTATELAQSLLPHAREGINCLTTAHTKPTKQSQDDEGI